MIKRVIFHRERTFSRDAFIAFMRCSWTIERRTWRERGPSAFARFTRQIPAASSNTFATRV